MNMQSQSDALAHERSCKIWKEIETVVGFESRLHQEAYVKIA